MISTKKIILLLNLSYWGVTFTGLEDLPKPKLLEMAQHALSKNEFYAGDTEHALRCLRAAQDYPPAAFFAGQIFDEGLGGIEPNKRRAYKWYKFAASKAAEQRSLELIQLGLPIYMNNFASDIYSERYLRTGNLEHLSLAHKLFCSAASYELSDAVFNAGLTAFEKFTHSNKQRYLDQAVLFMESAKTNGDPRAQAQLAHMCLLEYVSPNNQKEYQTDLQVLAQYGNTQAQKALQQMQEQEEEIIVVVEPDSSPDKPKVAEHAPDIPQVEQSETETDGPAVATEQTPEIVDEKRNGIIKKVIEKSRCRKPKKPVQLVLDKCKLISQLAQSDDPERHKRTLQLYQETLNSCYYDPTRFSLIEKYSLPAMLDALPDEHQQQVAYLRVKTHLMHALSKRPREESAGYFASNLEDALTVLYECEENDTHSDATVLQQLNTDGTLERFEQAIQQDNQLAPYFEALLYQVGLKDPNIERELHCYEAMSIYAHQNNHNQSLLTKAGKKVALAQLPKLVPRSLKASCLLIPELCGSTNSTDNEQACRYYGELLQKAEKDPNIFELMKQYKLYSNIKVLVEYNQQARYLLAKTHLIRAMNHLQAERNANAQNELREAIRYFSDTPDQTELHAIIMQKKCAPAFYAWGIICENNTSINRAFECYRQALIREKTSPVFPLVMQRIRNLATVQKHPAAFLLYITTLIGTNQNYDDALVVLHEGLVYDKEHPEIGLLAQLQKENIVELVGKAVSSNGLKSYYDALRYKHGLAQPTVEEEVACYESILQTNSDVHAFHETGKVMALTRLRELAPTHFPAGCLLIATLGASDDLEMQNEAVSWYREIFIPINQSFREILARYKVEDVVEQLAKNGNSNALEGVTEINISRAGNLIEEEDSSNSKVLIKAFWYFQRSIQCNVINPQELMKKFVKQSFAPGLYVLGSFFYNNNEFQRAYECFCHAYKSSGIYPVTQAQSVKLLSSLAIEKNYEPAQLFCLKGQLKGLPGFMQTVPDMLSLFHSLLMSYVRNPDATKLHELKSSGMIPEIQRRVATVPELMSYLNGLFAQYGLDQERNYEKALRCYESDLDLDPVTLPPDRNPMNRIAALNGLRSLVELGYFPAKCELVNQLGRSQNVKLQKRALELYNDILYELRLVDPDKIATVDQYGLYETIKQMTECENENTPQAFNLLASTHVARGMANQHLIVDPQDFKADILQGIVYYREAIKRGNQEARNCMPDALCQLGKLYNEEGEALERKARKLKGRKARQFTCKAKVKFVQARERFQEATKYNSQEAHAHLAVLILWHIWQDDYKQKDFNNCIKILKKVAPKMPTVATILATIYYYGSDLVAQSNKFFIRDHKQAFTYAQMGSRTGVSAATKLLSKLYRNGIIDGKGNRWWLKPDEKKADEIDKKFDIQDNTQTNFAKAEELFLQQEYEQAFTLLTKIQSAQYPGIHGLLAEYARQGIGKESSFKISQENRDLQQATIHVVKAINFCQFRVINDTLRQTILLIVKDLHEADTLSKAQFLRGMIKKALNDKGLNIPLPS